MIRYNKKQFYHYEIMKTEDNIKGLYHVLYRLTGENEDQQWPSEFTNEQLSEKFASYFLTKIENIHKQFSDIPMFEPCEHSVPKFTKLAPLTEQETHKLIMTMKTKSCELDIIPTKILKEILPACLPSITKLVNFSLEQGFASDWKLAIIRPLPKKIGLELIFKNYRPVSNLFFLSKVVEKATLN